MLTNKRSPFKPETGTGECLEPVRKKSCTSLIPPTRIGPETGKGECIEPVRKKSCISMIPPTRVIPKIFIEDKENADPLENDGKISEGEDNDVDTLDCSTNSDGFDVCDGIRLDDPNSESNDESAPESSPFMKSLIRNKMVFSIDKSTSLKLLSGEEGCSPALSMSTGKSNSNRDSETTPMAPPIGKFRRCISMVERPIFPQDLLFQPISDLKDFTSPVSRASFKRPVAPSQDDGFLNSKKSRGLEINHPKLLTSKSTSSLCTSPSIASIMHACSLSDKPNLTADRSCQLSLPTINGSNKNLDLNNIDSQVLANLLNGKYDDKVSSYRIIDARYGYEYEGGHIRGAENFGMWDEKRFLKEFFPTSLEPKKIKFNPESGSLESSDNASDAKRNILIFHCEFSSARGPALLRMLRKKDREINKDTYPALHYPECYLLHEGYKAFYASYPNLCVPESYVPMNHPSFISEERSFHKKSRSWAAGGAGTLSRTGSSSRLLKL